jgi:CRP-like cAMP-binding protein
MATVRALTDGPVEVMALPRDAFQQMLAGSDQAGEALAMTMVERLIELMEHTENID